MKPKLAVANKKLPNTILVSFAFKKLDDLSIMDTPLVSTGVSACWTHETFLPLLKKSLAPISVREYGRLFLKGNLHSFVLSYFAAATSEQV